MKNFKKVKSVWVNAVGGIETQYGSHKLNSEKCISAMENLNSCFSKNSAFDVEARSESVSLTEEA
jgi:hypothetical protein